MNGGRGEGLLEGSCRRTLWGILELSTMWKVF